MNGHRLMGAVFLSMAAGALPPAAVAMKDAPSSIDTTYGKLPARLCLAVDATQWRRLRDGSGRLALEVINHTPAVRYSPTFSVRVADDAAKKPDAEARRFGLSIDRVAGDGRAEPQHFDFDLSAELTGRADAPRLCVEVDVDHDSDDAKTLASTGVTVSASISSL